MWHVHDKLITANVVSSIISSTEPTKTTRSDCHSGNESTLEEKKQLNTTNANQRASNTNTNEYPTDKEAISCTAESSKQQVSGNTTHWKPCYR